MSIETNLKTKITEARLAKSKMLPFLQFVLSEITRVGKNKDNRATTEDEAITVIKKMIENSNKTIELSQFKGAIQAEIDILNSLLPAMVDSATIAQLVNNYVSTSEKPNKGELMKMLKARYGSLIDLKLAGSMFESISNAI
jgi:uncharacterized protein YqeY